MKIVGILLIVAGFAAVVFGGFSSPNRSQVPDMGLIQVEDAEYHPMSAPPILGIAVILVGGGLLISGFRQTR
jgi:hypothetical protein